MIKYRLKENCISPSSAAPMEDYLRSLGITKTSSFINGPAPEDELSPRLLTNIDRCISMLHDGFEQNKKFLLIVDCDVDGYTSSAIFYRYFKSIYPNANIVWQLHEGKEHGLEADKLDNIGDDIDYIIIPDAGSAQLDEQQVLLDRGKKIIVIDHHDITETIDNPNIVVVNNQGSANFINKDLSGAGVVLKVVQEYDNTYLYNFSKDYYDLAALGIVSDMMSMRTLDNNAIVWKGLANINNPMFAALLEQQSFSIKNTSHPTKVDISFYIAPLINGVIRAGTQEEKELLFRGFICDPTGNTIETVYRGETRIETFYAYVARNAYNIKNRQNTQKEKCMRYLKTKIESKGWQNNQVIVVVTTLDDEVPTPENITGLVAMELHKEYNKPVLVLRPKKEDGVMYYRGSGRGKQADGFDSFLQFMRDSKYCNYAEGHKFAFGASIAANDLKAFLEESNERLKDVDFGTDIIEVDAIFNETNINVKMLKEFAEYSYVYGNMIPQPLIAITCVSTPANTKIMGADLSSVKVSCGGVDCVKFKDQELAAKITAADKNKVTIIGKSDLNEWMGRVTVQLKANYFEVEPLKASVLF